MIMLYLYPGAYEEFFKAGVLEIFVGCLELFPVSIVHKEAKIISDFNAM